MPEKGYLVDVQIRFYKFGHLFSVFHEHIFCESDIILRFIITLAAISLVPCHNRKNVCPLARESVVDFACRRAGTAVQIE